MLNIVLSLIGIVLIIYSIYIIKKDLLKDKIAVKELHSIEKNVKKHSNHTNEITSDFNELVEAKIEKIDIKAKEENRTFKKENSGKNKENQDFIISNDSNKKIDPIHKKILELLEIGLTKEEIAKKMNKGIREVEIILRMYSR